MDDQGTNQPVISPHTQAASEIDESELSYMERRNASLPFIPKSEWEHKTFLADTTKPAMRASSFDLLTKEIMLANIKSDRMLMLYQVQGTSVLEWDFLGLNPIKNLRLSQLLLELNMTRSKDFAERRLQANEEKVKQLASTIEESFKKAKQDGQGYGVSKV